MTTENYHPQIIVQRRDNSMSRVWETIEFVKPEEVSSLNADYGWRKYRVMREVAVKEAPRER
jgi:hypothetical protein